jgi:ABC-type nitrate/sulfonate/bicarbonate transport system substrate-binding protein
VQLSAGHEITAPTSQFLIQRYLNQLAVLKKVSGTTRERVVRDNEKTLIAFIRGFTAAYAWLQDPKNKTEAIEILNARLRIAPVVASAEFDRFGAQPRPRVTPGGLGQVIGMVWEAEGYKAPPGTPDKYFDLGYLQKADG